MDTLKYLEELEQRAQGAAHAPLLGAARSAARMAGTILDVWEPALKPLRSTSE